MHRKDGGENSYRAGKVNAVKNAFPSMAFHINQDGCAIAGIFPPFQDAKNEPGEEHVIDSRMKCPRDPVQQRSSHFWRQREDDLVSAAHRIAAANELLAGNKFLCVLRHVSPEGEFLHSLWIQRLTV